ncbi:MAG: phosphoglycerate dehydrogenase [Nitrospinota bacterium]|nr:phosphoglycerate dehydrogenase [Nitrospinota bacterium]
MTRIIPRVAVTPPPICNSSTLRGELSDLVPQPLFNDTGRYLTEDELIRFAGEADALLVGRDRITDKVLSALPQLKIIAKYGVGLDNLDSQALQRHQVELGWTAGVNRRSVAELTLSLMLGLCHNAFQSGWALKQGQWVKEGGQLLQGKIVGIVGCGNIGKEVVRLLKPFECKVWIRDILSMSEFCKETGALERSFEEVLSGADIISLHVPLTAETRHMIHAATLQKMRQTAFLINTSRGDVVNQTALKEALVKETIAGAALDVFSQEPPEDMELLAHPRLMVTPHIGGNAIEAVEAMARAAFQHLKEFFSR